MRHLTIAALLLSTAAHADPAAESAALATHAEHLWSASCGGRELCVTERPADARTTRCHAGPLLRVEPRHDAKAALAALTDVVAFAAKHPDVPAIRHDGALAQLHLADADLERYLALEFPTALDFSDKTKATSKARFDAWVQERSARGSEASRAYELVLARKDPETSVLAAARVARLSEDFAAVLRTAPVPRDVRTGDFAKDKTDAFCVQMEAVAEPLVKRATQAYATCATKATELKVDGRVCRAQAI